MHSPSHSSSQAPSDSGRRKGKGKGWLLLLVAVVVVLFWANTRQQNVTGTVCSTKVTGTKGNFTYTVNATSGTYSVDGDQAAALKLFSGLTQDYTYELSYHGLLNPKLNSAKLVSSDKAQGRKACTSHTGG